MTTLIAPDPKLHFVDNNGNALSGGLLFTYQAGTTTKQSTFTDSGGLTANANPIVLSTRGECNCWLTAGQSYKFVLSPSTDTDPPTNPIWTVDNIIGGISTPVAISQGGTGAATAATALANLGGLPLSGGTMTGNLVMSGARIDEASSTLASATTVNIGAASANYIFITGTTTITGFDTIAAGPERTLEFAGVLTLTHNATTLILPNNGNNITTAAGDTAKFRSEGAGNWRCVAYTRASGQSLSGAIAKLSHTLASSASNPALTAAVWNQTPLQTQDYDTGSNIVGFNGSGGAGSNQFVLAAGTYFIDVSTTVAWSCGPASIRLRNTSGGGSTLLVGLSGQAATTNGANVPLRLAGQFTIAAAQALEIDVWVGNAVTAGSFSTTTGESNVFTLVLLTRRG